MPCTSLNDTIFVPPEHNVTHAAGGVERRFDPDNFAPKDDSTDPHPKLVAGLRLGRG